MADVEVCPVEELPPGAMRLVRAGALAVGVYNFGGELLRDRGPLLARRRAALRGRLGAEEGVVVCPRHGANFDIRTGQAADAARRSSRSTTYPVSVERRHDRSRGPGRRLSARRARPRRARAPRGGGRRERERGVPASERSRQVAPTTGRFLFALVAPQAGCEVLEIGGSRGYSTIWLAAAARILGGTRRRRSSTIPAKCEAWRREHRRGRARGVGRARRGRRVRDAAGDRGRLRRRLPRRREGRLRGALRARPARGRARRARGRRQRSLPRGDAGTRTRRPARRTRRCSRSPSRSTAASS